MEYKLKEDTWVCSKCHKQPAPIDLTILAERLDWTKSHCLLAETIEIDKNPSSCYQFAIKTMQRLGAVPTEQDPPKVFDLRFVETGERGTILVEPSKNTSNSSLTVCLGNKSQPEALQRMRTLAKQIIVEMNPPELTMRHEGVIMRIDAKGFLLELPPCPNCGAPLSLSEDRALAKCSHCGSMHPTIKQVQ